MEQYQKRIAELEKIRDEINSTIIALNLPPDSDYLAVVKKSISHLDCRINHLDCHINYLKGLIK